MTFWKPHNLASPEADQLDLRIGDTVRTTVDLPGIAAGTDGRVMLANGFNWQRYRVRFSVDGVNVEVGDLDGRQLEPTGRAARRVAKAAAAAAAG